MSKFKSSKQIFNRSAHKAQPGADRGQDPKVHEVLRGPDDLLEGGQGEVSSHLS